MQRKQEEISKDGEERKEKTKQYYRVILKYIQFTNVDQSINHIFEGVKKSTILYHLFHKEIILTFYHLF